MFMKKKWTPVGCLPLPRGYICTFIWQLFLTRLFIMLKIIIKFPIDLCMRVKKEFAIERGIPGNKTNSRKKKSD